ncbi:MAG: hypothetical protein LBS01_07850 [Prevotellaceae bacterium]|jgi:ABC-type multidrug transport system fused ATPase/permease subunit|nr:hypothetical protein [Prevotellaceae bacterium]
MKIILVVFSAALFLSFGAIQAQAQTDSLSFQGAFFGFNYFVNGQTVSSADFISKLSQRDAQLASSFRSGKSLEIAGEVIGCVGAYFIGFDLGTRLAGGSGSSTMLLCGGTALAGGLVMIFTGSSKMRKAVELYNSANSQTTVNLNISPMSVGLCINF